MQSLGADKMRSSVDLSDGVRTPLPPPQTLSLRPEPRAGPPSFCSSALGLPVMSWSEGRGGREEDAPGSCWDGEQVTGGVRVLRVLHKLFEGESGDV